MKKEILTLFMSGCSVILAAQTTGTVVDETSNHYQLQRFRCFVKAKIR